MKKYLLIGLFIMFILMIVIEDRGLLDDFERAAANENWVELVGVINLEENKD